MDNVLTRIPPVAEMTPEQMEAYKAMLRNLKSKQFYEQPIDNPENVAFEDESQTMQPASENIERALKGTRREEMLKKILEQSR
jgi:hypothetical protein